MKIWKLLVIFRPKTNSSRWIRADAAACDEKCYSAMCTSFYPWLLLHSGLNAPINCRCYIFILMLLCFVFFPDILFYLFYVISEGEIHILLGNENKSADKKWLSGILSSLGSSEEGFPFDSLWKTLSATGFTSRMYLLHLSSRCHV